MHIYLSFQLRQAVLRTGVESKQCPNKKGIEYSMKNLLIFEYTPLAGPKLLYFMMSILHIYVMLDCHVVWAQSVWKKGGKGKEKVSIVKGDTPEKPIKTFSFNDIIPACFALQRAAQ